jgi:CPA1 family monovalent cation:H+ antiporter
MVGLISAVVIGVRFIWLFTMPYLIRAVDRRPQQRLRRAGARSRVVSAMSGFRGAVSMAAALAVPQNFPGRDVIIFVTAGVIVVTLVLQASLLPVVVRWARLPPDVAVEQERLLALTVSTEEALAAMPDVATRLGTHEEVVKRLREDYEQHLRVLRLNGEDAGDEETRRAEADYLALRLELLAHKRATVVRLRDERQIDDTVLRYVQSKLDVEEVRLTRREIAE